MDIVNLNGRIVNIFNGKNVGIVTLKVVDGSFKKKYTNYPQIVYKKNDKAVLFDFVKGNYVKIEGTIIVKNEKEEENLSFSQFIRGARIFSISSNDGISEPLFKNEVIIRGEITGILQLGGAASVLIQPENQKFNVRLIKYNAEKFLKKYNKGDEVEVRGRIQTAKENGKSKESIVIHTIKKI